MTAARAAQVCQSFMGQRKMEPIWKTANAANQAKALIKKNWPAARNLLLAGGP
jgi:hypothetical protein